MLDLAGGTEEFTTVEERGEARNESGMPSLH